MAVEHLDRLLLVLGPELPRNNSQREAAMVLHLSLHNNAKTCLVLYTLESSMIPESEPIDPEGGQRRLWC
jgi:hypothetical protein